MEAAGGSRVGIKVGRALIAWKVEKEKFFKIIGLPTDPAASSVRGCSLDTPEAIDLIGIWFGSGLKWP